MCWMLRGRRLHDWSQTGSLLAMTANANRNPKKRRRPYGLADFVPTDLRQEFRAPRGMRLTRDTLHALKPLFAREDADGA